MRRLITAFGLSNEAILFDSKLYIIKAILAIGTGYIVGKISIVARLDMISVLLGVMYNLEPINIVGVKSGVSQLISSTLGAICTSILIVFLGINVFTIAISMGLTLYLSLKINWRMISPVAIFTCIYMTQYIQKNSLGNPSIWLTFKLRIVALGIGVIIAILYNYLFSFIYYREIAYKRLEFAKLRLLNGLEYTKTQLKNKCINRGKEYITLFPYIFNDLDLVHSNIELVISESKYLSTGEKRKKLQVMQKILEHFWQINHLAYDINFEICKEEKYDEFDKNSFRLINKAIENLRIINFISNNKTHELLIDDIEYKSIVNSNDRIYSNISAIELYTKLVVKEVRKLDSTL
ncbi:hypothetical protein [Clostridium sp. BSD9I1]|uniref:hypothetical protein n=1 Tax=Clostridium sp. BSD9I1 TaxID=2003589 RepID=UPI00164498CC|nr:hypothetical protein [Clostridium sp. BSD9I1]